MITEQRSVDLAERLDQAATTRTTIAPLSKDEAAFDAADAYRVQERLVQRRVERGARVLGGKLGLTSKAKQVAMGVHEPLYAWITSDMARISGGILDLDELIHPRVEPEIAFVLGRPLRGADVGVTEVLAATDRVCAALDVIDSRYDGFSFTHPDAVADNGSSAAFALGTDLVEPTMDLALAACNLEVDGVITDSAAGAAVMGHPAEAVAFMVRALARIDRGLEAGWVVLSGGLTAPVPMTPGRTVTSTIAGIGSVTLTAK